jgi:hypothetical protein
MGRLPRIVLGALMFFAWVESCPAQTKAGPIIHVDQTVHTFPLVFEGETLSHSFTVFNRGTAELKMERVSTS